MFFSDTTCSNLPYAGLSENRVPLYPLLNHNFPYLDYNFGSIQQHTPSSDTPIWGYCRMGIWELNGFLPGGLDGPDTIRQLNMANGNLL